jgi:hypothetical protein
MIQQTDWLQLSLGRIEGFASEGYEKKTAEEVWRTGL